jgi:hypothetical protein
MITYPEWTRENHYQYPTHVKFPNKHRKCVAGLTRNTWSSYYKQVNTDKNSNLYEKKSTSEDNYVIARDRIFLLLNDFKIIG